MAATLIPDTPTPDPAILDEPARSFAAAVKDQFAVKSEIGRGGMGIVYLARDKRLDRLVAIKALPPAVAADPAVRERFIRETRTAGAMSHPNIVPIHGANDVAGHVFFVMSFIDGDSLAAQVRAQGALDQRAVVRHLRDVALALDHAHKRGIIHRDVKAENILIERASGRALVTDFGIARLAEAKPLTATGQLVGTVYYVSPEQVSGAPGDARSDIYALGVVGYLALSGLFPFDAEIASAVLVAHVTKPAAPLLSVSRDVTPALAGIVDRCLHKDPGMRFASAEQLAAAIEAVIPIVDRHVAAGPERPRLITDTDAHAVWERAAELQALTGVQPRPAAVPGARARSRAADPSDGLAVDDVAAAAREAGIDESYVQHALVEHGLTEKPSSLPRPVPRRDHRLHPRGNYEDTIVDGELRARDFERIVNVLRDCTGELGEVTASARELGWFCTSFGRRTHISVVPEDGRTLIRVIEDDRRRAVLTYAASVLLIGGLIGFGVGGLVSGFVRGDEGPFAAWFGVIVASFPTAAGIRRLDSHGKRARLYSIAQTIAAKVRDCIDLDKRK